MNNPQELKELIIKQLIEKGEYDKVLAHIGSEEKESGLTKLIKPMSAVADILTENAKGAFMEDLEKRLDDATTKGNEQLRKDLEEAHQTLKTELQGVVDTNRDELSSDILNRVTEAQERLQDTLARYADDIVTRKADAIFATLAEQARLTEDEIQDIVDEASLSVESQIADIIGDYVAETGITTAQIKDFDQAVKKLLPADRQVTWNEIVGKPDISQGGTNTNVVRQMIATALADFGGGLPSGGTTGQSLVKASNADGDVEWATPAGGGDMLASVYDPANGAKQVAFNDELHSAVTLAGEDFLSLTGQQITANPIDLDNLSATGTPSASTFLRGDNTWATPSGGAVDSVNGATGIVVLDTDDIGEGATNLYYTDVRVSANTDVAANTSARHSAVTLDGTPDYITIAGQVITRALINLTSHVTERLPFANLASGTARSVVGRAGSGNGDVGNISAGNDTILSRSGSGDVAFNNASTVRTILNVADGATANTGTVTSVAVSGSDGIEVDSGSPVTGSGTIALGVNKTTLLSHINVEDGADVTDATNVGAVNASASSKTTPVDADSFPIVNSESSNAIGRVTFTNLKAFLKTYFDTLYATLASPTFTGVMTYERAESPTTNLGNLGTTETINFNTATHFRGTLDDDVTITISNVSNGQTGRISLYYSGAQRTVTFSGAKPIGTLPDEPASADEVTVYTVWNDGVNTFISGGVADVS